MKLLIFTLTTTFLIFGIQNNNLLSTKNNLIEETKESYQACIRLRNKAPNLNLKCEHLLDNLLTIKETNKKNEIINNEIKTLFISESNTRKVNKSEEIKLKNLIKNLSNKNQPRKD